MDIKSTIHQDDTTKPVREYQATARELIKTDIVVIDAAQARLSSAYHLNRIGIEPGRGFVVLGQSESPGGAWQYRWPSLTLTTANRIHDVPGLGMAEAMDISDKNVKASSAVPKYYEIYEKTFNLPGYRPVKVMAVCDRKERKSTRLNSSHVAISYAVFCLKKKKNQQDEQHARNPK